MSHTNDLADLHAQHEALKKQIADMMSHPATTDAEIAEVKRKKLRLKDEIFRLENTRQAA